MEPERPAVMSTYGGTVSARSPVGATCLTRDQDPPSGWSDTTTWPPGRPHAAVLFPPGPEVITGSGAVSGWSSDASKVWGGLHAPPIRRGTACGREKPSDSEADQTAVTSPASSMATWGGSAWAPISRRGDHPAVERSAAKT